MWIFLPSIASLKDTVSPGEGDFLKNKKKKLEDFLLRVNILELARICIFMGSFGASVIGASQIVISVSSPQPHLIHVSNTSTHKS